MAKTTFRLLDAYTPVGEFISRLIVLPLSLPFSLSFPLYLIGKYFRRKRRSSFELNVDRANITRRRISCSAGGVVPARRRLRRRKMTFRFRRLGIFFPYLPGNFPIMRLFIEYFAGIVRIVSRICERYVSFRSLSRRFVEEYQKLQFA